MSFTVNWPVEEVPSSRVIPDSTVTIEIVVLQSDIQVGMLIITRPESTGHLDNIPAGLVTVTAQAKDVNGKVVAEGSTEVTVVDDQNVSATLSLLAMAIGNMQDLGALYNNSNKSRAYGINNIGQVVGYSTWLPGTPSAGGSSFLWTAITSMQNLNTLSGGSPWLNNAIDINDNGQIVGSTEAEVPHHAFLWTPAIGVSDLGTLGGRNSTATAVNGNGQVVGYSDATNDPIPPTHAFFWSQSTGMLDLGTLGGMHSSAYDINDAGQVVGTASTTFGSHAFLWSPTAGMLDLGSLYGAGSASQAEGINNLGQVVGYSFAGGADSSVFLWSPSTGMQNLGNLGGFRCYPQDINDVGQIVGFAYAEDSSNSYPFIWSQSTGLLNLGSLGGSWGWARAINNAGQVVGESDTGRGYWHAFLWTPTVPMTKDTQGQRYIEIHTTDSDTFSPPGIGDFDRQAPSSLEKHTLANPSHSRSGNGRRR